MEWLLQSFNCNKKKIFFNLLLDSAETWKLPKLGLISYQPVMASTFVLSRVFAPRGCRDIGNELPARVLGENET